MPSNTVIFILSADRSGSTWLGYVLASNPDAAFVGEYYRAWTEGLQQPCALCDSRGYSDCRLLSGLSTVPAAAAFDFAFSRTTAKWLVDTSKTSAWVEQFSAPSSQYQVKTIHLIRDPRGWYESQRRRHSDSFDSLIGRWYQFNIDIRLFLERSGLPFQTVFYDEVAANAEETIPAISSQLGMTFDASSLYYWHKPHHGFAANGASSVLLRQQPNADKMAYLQTGDDRFYEAQGKTLFCDERWKTALDLETNERIRHHQGVASLLNVCDRVLLPSSLGTITSEMRNRAKSLDTAFVRDRNAAEVYLIRNGRRHWVSTADWLQAYGARWPDDVLQLEPGEIEGIPFGEPVGSAPVTLRQTGTWPNPA